MKRFFAFIVAVLYTFSSIGMTVSTHYCAGKQMTCKCAKPKTNSQKDHCCKDTVKFVKAQDNHQGSELTSIKKSATVDFQVVAIHSNDLNLNTIAAANLYLKQPPDIYSGPNLYDLFCNYRI